MNEELAIEEMMNYVKRLQEEMVQIRRDLHRNPELLYDVVRTSGKVSALLEAWGLDEVQMNIGKHFGMGVVGTLAGTAGDGPTILLRADMDALPIAEKNETGYKSLNEGVMHACGHDAHTAMLLGAARTLAEFRHLIKGKVVFIFQPAEEGASRSPIDGRLLSGGRDMIEAGILEGVHYAYALHVMPDLPVGTLGIHPRYAMAASTHFKLDFQGKAGHHSAPHLAADAIQMAGRFIAEANGIMANQVNPSEAAVLAFGTLHAGTGINVIAEHSELTGTFRAFSKSTVQAITDGLHRHASAIAASLGGQYTLELREGIAVVNNEAAVRLALETAGFIFGQQNVQLLEQSSLAGEDFGWYLDRVPGVFAFIGCGNKEKGISYPLHHPQFDIDEAVLWQGAQLLVRLALQHNPG